MKIEKTTKFLIVGLGLIGGSYARALKKRGYFVSAVEPRQAALDYAFGKGIIDEGFTDVDENAVKNADIIVFALYPRVFVEWIDKYGKFIKPGTLLTDVTGVKSCIVYDVQKKLPSGVEFIAAHPMAGREVYGVENSSDKIFRDANYIVVPTDKNTPEAIETCKDLGWLLGFDHVSVLSPEMHDEMIGFVSQLTHCIAVTLMTCSDNTDLVDYTGDSFRDLTRIARINEDMWSELFILNKDALLSQMDAFIKEFEAFRDMLDKGDVDGMKEKMRLSTLRRAMFDKRP